MVRLPRSVEKVVVGRVGQVMLSACRWAAIVSGQVRSQSVASEAVGVI